MPKFYVSSGNLKAVLCANDPTIAAINALLETNENLGRITMVSETGFDSESHDNVYFNTSYLLKKAGIEENYQDIEENDLQL